MNDIGKKAAKANNLRRTHDLQLHEASVFLSGSADSAASRPHLRAVANQVESEPGEAPAAEGFTAGQNREARRA